MIASQSVLEMVGVAPKRAGGMKWSEVCERVTQPDGSVRTSPRINGGITSAVSPSTVSPPRLRSGSHGLQKLSGSSRSGASYSHLSRNGSSRGGSSGTASRSSSLDGSHKARDGDVSSRGSSGWDTCTNASEQSRPRSPDVIPSPSGGNSLLMPAPIRTGLIWPPSFLDDDPMQPNIAGDGVSKLEEVEADVDVDTELATENHVAAESGPGPTSFKWDPHARDVPKRNCETKTEWSVEPLVKYFKRAVAQIEGNIETRRLPTAAKLDAFVSRLVANTQRLLKHAPKDLRRALQTMMTRHFQRFWHFSRNEKIRGTNPDELKCVMTSLIEALMAEFSVSPAALMAPVGLHGPLPKSQHLRNLDVDPSVLPMIGSIARK